MTENIASLKKRIEELEEANSLYAELERRRSSELSHEKESPRRIKDFSLQTLINSWSGDEGSTSIQEYLRSIELIGASGNWDDGDIALVTRMRLKGQAAAFLASRSELQGIVSYAELKSALLERFSDRTSPQQYLLQLSSMAQLKGENVHAFADRCISVGQKSLTGEGSLDEKRGAARQIDKVVLTAYMKGLKGEIGKYIRMQPPSTIKEAVSRAALIEAELELEGPREAYVINEVVPASISTCTCRVERGDEQVKMVKKDNSFFNRPKENQSTRESQSRQHMNTKRSRTPPGPCFRCGRQGHWARNCAQKQNFPNGSGPRNPPTAGRL